MPSPQSAAAAIGALCLALVGCSASAIDSPTVHPSGAAPTASAEPSSGTSEQPGIDIASLAGQIVFDDSQDIWSMNADGTGLTRLTRESWREFDPSLSPDRRTIVYRAEPNDYPELWVMNADGSDQQRLSPDGGFPAWSPDGSMLAYAPAGGDSGQSWIAIMNADGSDVRRLPHTDFGENPSWSPDGARIAFTSAHTGVRYIYIVDLDDGSRLVDLSSAGEGTQVAWSPDGDAIAFASQRDHSDYYRDIYVMRPDGSDVRRLTLTRGETPAWSPDGRYIIYSAASGFGVVRADGSGATSLPVAGIGWASMPDWR